MTEGRFSPLPLHDGRWIALCLAVALVLAFLWGCVPADPVHNPVIVGDSIVFGAQSHGAFGPSPNVYIDAQPGRGMVTPGIVVGPGGSWQAGTTGVEAILDVLPHKRPDGWTVIELGANNLTEPAAQLESEITSLISMVPGCLAWVNVWNSQVPWLASKFNVALVTAMSRRGVACTAIINWAGEAQIHPEYLTDGLHTSPVGSIRLAQLIRRTTG